MIRIRHSTHLILFSTLLGLLFALSLHANANAAGPIVRGVLFYSPTCGHCEKVITEVLPPLAKLYGDQLEILQIDVTMPQGQQLYQNTIQKFKITEDRTGVPTLVVGETVLVGSREIPEQLPGLIESGLKEGGIIWPAIPDLEAVLPAVPVSVENSGNTQSLVTATTQTAPEPDPGLSSSSGSGFTARFKQDITANTLAVIVLVAMLLSSVYVAYAFLAADPPRLPRFPAWAIPVISVLGLGVALYLSYVELYQAEAICGPVGNCNAVQNSPYAYLFGVIPVGVVGAVGYIALLASYLLVDKGSESLRRTISLAMWGMAWIGTFFSIYLTFLEPFVIGATCMWCLTSAILMTLLLWATTPAALAALHSDEPEEELEGVG
ncbi:MAG TPA: vitamin K epoxide reductase family protein [Anaerolineales bacterium]|nr:vitamin K epoxide reductase family protein [Anaerolineales bacterium]